MTGLDHLNRLSSAEAEAALRGCCASGRWAAAVAAGRPYASPAALLDAAERDWWALEPADWLEAFAAHPRIGERGVAEERARREQAGVAGASAATRAALAEGNRRYEERFGFVFLICASGKSADEMLAALRRRLAGDPADELRTAAGEQAAITRLRLEALLSLRLQGGAGSPVHPLPLGCAPRRRRGKTHGDGPAEPGLRPLRPHLFSEEALLG
jgi:OHCU decarboxylase